MQTLDSTFDFDARPSRSQYAPVIKALIEDGVPGVKLVRGEDFPQGVKMQTVQAGISTAMRKASKKAQTRVISDDEIAVRIHPDQAPRRRGRRARETTAA